MTTTTGTSLDSLWGVLETVLDPEVPVLSVVELGIVRDVTADEDGVTVTVTPTYSGCPAMQVIERDILDALAAHGVAGARVRTVYAPAWTTDWMSEEARAKLKAYGIAPPGVASRTESGSELVPLRRRRVAPVCPFCDSTDTEPRSDFGSTACKSLAYCNGCHQPFELFKAI